MIAAYRQTHSSRKWVCSEGRQPLATVRHSSDELGELSQSQGPHYLTIMKPPLNLPLKMAEWQETSVNAFL